MTFDSFVKRFIGKAVDYDGVSGVQCVDLVKLYLYNVFGIRAGAWGNARDYWLDFNSHKIMKENFTKIAFICCFRKFSCSMYINYCM